MRTGFRAAVVAQPAPPAKTAAAHPQEQQETVSFTELFRRNVGQVRKAAAREETSAPAAAPPPVPTVESEFGPNPWLEDPKATGPMGEYSLNRTYFATPEAAAKVARLLGGKVVECDNILGAGVFSAMQPNQMVEMPDGRRINAGQVITFFSHGYPKAMVDAMIANEIHGEVNA